MRRIVLATVAAAALSVSGAGVVSASGPGPAPTTGPTNACKHIPLTTPPGVRCNTNNTPYEIPGFA